jgi:multiple sugar transport system substrate-binding protein
MNQSRSGPRALIALVGVIAVIAAACGGSAASTAPSAAPSEATVASAAPSPEPTPLLTPEPIDASVPGPNGGQIIRWFVGLGAGGQPQQIQVQKDFVTAFNNDPANKDKAYISLEILDNNVAANILKTQIAAGNAPDIIGPVGVEGLNLFIDQVADLQPLIDSTGYDMSKYPEALADFFKIGKDGATIGVPFGTYPSFLWYNKKLFDEAKLPYPPTEVGAMYEGKPWDMAAVRELGMKLTVDADGNDATSPDFDPANIVQWGFDSQWADNAPTAETALFGAGSFLAEDGKTAQIPDAMRTGIHWFNDGVWKDHFIPNQNQVNGDLLAKGNPFQSGNLAMTFIHTWYSCCVNPAAPAEPIVGDDFGWAVAPSYNGTTTAKLHADTFSMLKDSKHPDEAFAVLSALAASGELATIYGAMPADPAQTQPFKDAIEAAYPNADLDWAVPEAMLGNPDIPNHQAWVPDYAKSKAAWQAFGVGYRTAESADIDADLDKLQTTLQGIFDAAPDKNP